MTTLIAYATKYGCTEKCAKILAEKLMGKIDLCNLNEAKAIDLTPYDKVIIGGSIYAGKIRKEAWEFCEKNLNILKEKKIALFICGMHEKNAETELNAAFPHELLNRAIAKEFFGGEFRFQKMNLLERFVVKKVTNADKSIPPIDTTKDISKLSEININRFVELIKEA